MKRNLQSAGRWEITRMLGDTLKVSRSESAELNADKPLLIGVISL